MQLTITQLNHDKPYIVTGEGDLLHSFANFTQLVDYLADELEEELDDQTDIIEDLEKELQDAETKVDDLESDKEKLEETISTLETTIHNLEGQLSCNTLAFLPSGVTPTDTAPTSTLTPS